MSKNNIKPNQLRKCSATGMVYIVIGPRKDNPLIYDCHIINTGNPIFKNKLGKTSFYLNGILDDIPYIDLDVELSNL